MSTSPNSTIARLVLGLFGLVVGLFMIAGMVSCGGSSASFKSQGGGGGGGGGSRTINDMLFAADFNKLAGYQVGSTWCPTDSAGNVAAISTLRIWDSGMKWADIETANGQFDWSNMDHSVNTLAADPNCPMNVIYTVGNTPKWASACAGQADPSPCLPGPTTSGYGGGTECAPEDGTNDFSCTPPSDVNSDGTGSDLQFQTFIAALTDRYVGKIKWYEVWNEADSQNFWCPDASSPVTPPPPASPSTCNGSLQRMVRMGWDLYNIVHCADSNAQVLSPSFHGFSSSQGGWMNVWVNTSISAPAGSITLPTSGKQCTWAAATVTGKQTFDITNFHGRGDSQSRPDPTKFLDAYNGAVGEIQRDSLPTPNGGFFDDENGYLGPSAAPNVELQAAYVAISYVLRASVTNPAITLSAWYSWDSGAGVGLQGSKAGLAYDVVAGWLNKSTVSNCSVSGTIYKCPGTTSSGKSFLIMWDMNFFSSCYSACQTATQPAPPGAAGTVYTTYTDISGAQNSIAGGAVPVGYQPILLTQ